MDALVISRREIGDATLTQTEQVGSLQKAIAKTKPGTRKHRRLVTLRKKTQAKTDRQLRDVLTITSRRTPPIGLVSTPSTQPRANSGPYALQLETCTVNQSKTTTAGT